MSHQQIAYDPAAVEDQLADLQAELQDEEALAAQLTDVSADNVANAKAFLNNSDTVNSQYDRLLDLDNKLRQLVASNAEKLALDKAHQDIVNSDEYQNLSKKVGDMRATIRSLIGFLVDSGVRGRPVKKNDE